MKVLYILLIFILCLSCSQNTIKGTDLWEGINNDTLRVYVRYELLDDNSDEVNGRDPVINVDALLMEEAKKRACMIMAGYEYYRKESDKDTVLSGRVDFEKGRMVARKCSEVYCHAIVDFTIRSH